MSGSDVYFSEAIFLHKTFAWVFHRKLFIIGFYDRGEYGLRYVVVCCGALYIKIFFPLNLLMTRKKKNYH